MAGCRLSDPPERGIVCSSAGIAKLDKDRLEGIGKKVTGSVKEAVGKVTGDTKLQAEGTADKAGGTAQNAVGGAKDAVRDSIKR